MKLLNEAMLLE